VTRAASVEVRARAVPHARIRTGSAPAGALVPADSARRREVELLGRITRMTHKCVFWGNLIEEST
jgi:hypothetical protein